jgi:hypothetical protein
MLQAAMVARDAFDAVGGFDQRLPVREDTAFFLALALQGPWCAVDHIGTRMTADADNRLTSEVPDHDVRYWRATVDMYRDVLFSIAGATKAQRADVRSRLAFAHWRLARLAANERNVGTSLRELGASVRVDPAMLPRRVIHRQR